MLWIVGWDLNAARSSSAAPMIDPTAGRVG
jgi:hypothetical protein